MDSLRIKTIEQTCFAACVSSSDNIDKTGTAFAREVSRSEDVMLPAVASAKQDEAINSDFMCKAGHKVAVTDIAPKIIDTELETLTTEPVKMRPKTTNTETANFPVIDPSLIESTQV
ncbi:MULTISPECIES: hypothetical protein, partial [unclassified Endozoicomonas]